MRHGNRSVGESGPIPSRAERGTGGATREPRPRASLTGSPPQTQARAGTSEDYWYASGDGFKPKRYVVYDAQTGETLLDINLEEETIVVADDDTQAYAIHAGHGAFLCSVGYGHVCGATE